MFVVSISFLSVGVQNINKMDFSEFEQPQTPYINTEIKYSDEIEFLVNYTIEYSHAKSEADLQKKNLRENRAIALLERLRFGDNSVFGGYRQSQEGGKPQVLTWPANALPRASPALWWVKGPSRQCLTPTTPPAPPST